MRIAWFPQLDEVGVFGVTAAIDVERDAKFVIGSRNLADILQRDGLTAAGVVGNGDGSEGDVLGAGFLDESP